MTKFFIFPLLLLLAACSAELDTALLEEHLQVEGVIDLDSDHSFVLAGFDTDVEDIFFEEEEGVFLFSSARYEFHAASSLTGTHECDTHQAQGTAAYKDGDTYYLEIEPSSDFLDCVEEIHEHEEVIVVTLYVHDTEV